MLRLDVRRSAGDTIIEVMIAIAIVSLVLVTGYTASNRSTNSLQDTQEHAQASRVASTQLEFLQANNGLDDTNQCFDPSGAPLAGDQQTCAYTANGTNNCADTDPYCYDVSITHTSDTYKVSVNWDSLFGSKDSVAMYYRIPPPVPPVVPPLVPGDPGGVSIGGFCLTHPASCAGDGSGSTSTTTYAHYGFQGYITSMNAGSSAIVSCIWDWGDKTRSTYAFGGTACKLDGKASHTYPTLPGIPEGAKCTASTKGVKYTAILYLKHQDGTQSISNTTDLWRPNCF